MRRRALGGVVLVVGAVSLASSATGLLGSRTVTSTAAPARFVAAAVGKAGVFTLRDGSLTRLDIQSPPGRLMIPPPASGPAARAITVGATRVWIAQGAELLGYTTNEDSPVPVWSTSARLASGHLLIASAGAWLWAATSGGREIRPINVHEPRVWPPTALNLAPVLGALVAVPAPIVGLAAGPASAWTLLRTHGGGSAVAVTTPDARARVAVSSPRAPIAISAYGELVCVLVRGQVIRINASTGHVVQHIPVPPSARTVSVYPGHVVLSVPATGEVIDISLRSPRTRAVTIVSAPVRAVVAGENDFWASAGADATPNKFYGF